MSSLSLFIGRQIHTNDHIVESTALPDHLIREATGQIAFEESGVRVSKYEGERLARDC